MSDKDYTKIAKDTGMGLQELFNAIKNSPHSTEEDKKRFAKLALEYTEFFEETFTTDKKPDKREKLTGISSLEAGTANVKPVL